MVGGDAVTQDGKSPSTGDVRDYLGLSRQIEEVGGLLHVGGACVPRVGVPFGNRQAVPALVTCKDVTVLFAEHLGARRSGHGGLDFVLSGPDIFEKDRSAIRPGA